MGNRSLSPASRFESQLPPAWVYFRVPWGGVKYHAASFSQSRLITGGEVAVFFLMLFNGMLPLVNAWLHNATNRTFISQFADSDLLLNAKVD